MLWEILFFLFLSNNGIDGYDFIRDALNSINQTSDPCDDFYRHACPKGSYGKLISLKFEPIFKELISQQKDKVWENLEISKALNILHVGEEKSQFLTLILATFEEMCKTNDFAISALLFRTQQMLTQFVPGECYGKTCLMYFAKDENCTRASTILKNHILRLNSSVNSEITVLKSLIQHMTEPIRAVNVLLDGEYRKGIIQINLFIKDMLGVLTEWISETPWVENDGATDEIESVAKDVYVDYNYGAQLKSGINSLMAAEEQFLNCSLDFHGKNDLFCLIYTNHYLASAYFADFNPFNLHFNAMNMHPKTIFSNHLYAVAADSEMAGKLGLAGLVAGHEFSHSLIEQQGSQNLLLAFSEEVVQCIQNQFNNTCVEFKEDSCEESSDQFEENGADILGLQLAYALFEKHYKERAQDEYIKLNQRNVTYQQLFFYASTLGLCSGSESSQSKDEAHSANNIRANVVAQHPAFQEAFQCSSDSRMMKTVEKQCVVYGKNAPLNRRKLQKT